MKYTLLLDRNFAPLFEETATWGKSLGPDVGTFSWTMDKLLRNNAEQPNMTLIS